MPNINELQIASVAVQYPFHLSDINTCPKSVVSVTIGCFMVAQLQANYPRFHVFVSLQSLDRSLLVGEDNNDAKLVDSVEYRIP